MAEIREALPKPTSKPADPSDVGAAFFYFLGVAIVLALVTVCCANPKALEPLVAPLVLICILGPLFGLAAYAGRGWGRVIGDASNERAETRRRLDRLERWMDRESRRRHG